MPPGRSGSRLASVRPPRTGLQDEAAPGNGTVSPFCLPSEDTCVTVSVSARTCGRNVRDRAPTKSAPAISVVIVSTGDRADLQRAMAVVLDVAPPACQLIVVRSAPVPAEMEAMILRCGAVFVPAPMATDPAGLRARGLTAASGHVVALREDRQIHDGAWLQRWAGAEGPVEVEVPVPTVAEASRRTAISEVMRPSAIVASG